MPTILPHTRRAARSLLSLLLLAPRACIARCCLVRARPCLAPRGRLVNADQENALLQSPNHQKQCNTLDARSCVAKIAYIKRWCCLRGRRLPRACRRAPRRASIGVLLFNRNTTEKRHVSNKPSFCCSSETHLDFIQADVQSSKQRVRAKIADLVLLKQSLIRW